MNIKEEKPNDKFETIYKLITKILKSAMKSKNLREFFQKIVKIGSKYTEASSCVCFLLQETNEVDGNILKIYEASGEDGKLLKDINAEYFIPDRKVFENLGDGERIVLEYVKKYFKTKLEYKDENFKEIDKKGEDILDELRRKGLSLMEVITEMGGDLSKLVKDGEFPMGITAYVAKTGDSVKLDGINVRKHQEWRGSYEGIHRICTSLIEHPLKLQKKNTIGLVKIENKKEKVGNPIIKSFSEIRNEKKICKKYRCFNKDDEFILELLTKCAIIAFENILSIKDTYKKLFGTEILKKIYELKIGSNELKNDTNELKNDTNELKNDTNELKNNTNELKSVINENNKKDSEINIKIYEAINEFYKPIKIIIEDYFSIETIFKKITITVNELATILNLSFIKDIIDNIGSRYEELLGSIVDYREHFIHQFQVFLLGYYIINKSETLKKILLNNVKKKENNFGFNEILIIWFLISCFHDYSYSFVKMDKWLGKYFQQIDVDYDLNIEWEKIASKMQLECQDLINILKQKCPNKDEKSFKEEFEKAIKDHGVMSSLLLKKKLRQDTNLNNKILDITCEAVALHTISIPDKDSKFKFEFCNLDILHSPFAFLLVFCDNVQQWGRIRMLDLQVDFNVVLKEINISDTEILLKLKYSKIKNDQERIINQKMNNPTKYWRTISNLNFKILLLNENDQRFNTLSYPPSNVDAKDLEFLNIKKKILIN